MTGAAGGGGDVGDVAEEAELVHALEAALVEDGGTEASPPERASQMEGLARLFSPVGGGRSFVWTC